MALFTFPIVELGPELEHSPVQTAYSIPLPPCQATTQAERFFDASSLPSSTTTFLHLYTCDAASQDLELVHLLTSTPTNLDCRHSCYSTTDSNYVRHKRRRAPCADGGRPSGR